MNLFRIIITILLSITFLVSHSQENKYIRILDFKVEDKMDFASSSLAELYAYQDDIGTWALLVLEFNGDENQDKLNVLGNAHPISGKYETEQIRGDYIKKDGEYKGQRRLRNMKTGKWYTPAPEEISKIREDVTKAKGSNQKWYSLLPEATYMLKVTHKDYHIEDKDWYNSSGYRLGRTENNVFVPNPELLHEGFFKGGMTYRLLLDIPKSVGNDVESKPVVAKMGWIIINSEPAGAKVFSIKDGVEILMDQRTPVMEKVPYGTYFYRISKNLYHDEEISINLNKEKVDTTMTLRPDFGSISITSTPSGAEVSLNYPLNQTYTTPCRIDNIPSGTYTLTLMKSAHTPYEQSVTVVGGEVTQVNASLDSRLARVTINSLPGAVITINGENKGTTTFSGDLVANTYDIEASLAGHKTVTKQINVVAKVPQTIELKPTPIYGTLDVMSTPYNATVTVDGKNVGTTPLTLDNLLIGSHTVTISMQGYTQHSETVTITENEPVTINARLQNGRSVTITTGKSGDAVYVDGTYVGVTPVTTELSFGSHELRATRNEDGKVIETSENITVSQGAGTLIFNLQLKSKSGSLSPRWSSSATAEQRRILGALIDNMVAVKGGRFEMGATSEQGVEYDSDERPTHWVTLSDYHIGKYEVTQEEWQAVMGNNPSYYKGNKKPVEQVSWNDCDEFIRRLNALTGIEFMLPTEAQWEYAARGGNMSKGYKYSGSNDIGRVAYYNKSSGGPTTVGSKQPNELGLYDMSGNVWEWCSDAWYSYGSSSATDPKHKGKKGSNRVYRGGCWNSSARYCRVSNRDYNSPGDSDYDLGLRLVCP